MKSTTNISIKVILFLFLLQYLNFNSQAQIPNSSFEHWQWFGWFSNPVSWNTNNTQITASMVVPDTVGLPNDTLAVKLINFGSLRPMVSCKFSCVTHPSALNALLKLNIIPSDTVSIDINLKYNGLVVDSGRWKAMNSISSYSQIPIPISQNVSMIDTIEIKILGGNKTLSGNGTTLIIDSMNFSFPSEIKKVVNHHHILSFFNYETKDYIFCVKDYTRINNNCFVVDLNGKIIKYLSSNSSNNEFKVGNLPSGIYLFTVNSLTIKESILFVVP